MITRTEYWNNRAIRFVEHNNEWWAVAKDVIEALGYNETEKLIITSGNTAYSELLEDKGIMSSFLLMNEEGIYQAIFRSKKPEALDFQNLVLDVTFDIVKNIRAFLGFEVFEIFRMTDEEELKRLKNHVEPSIIKKLFEKLLKIFQTLIRRPPMETRTETTLKPFKLLSELGEITVNTFLDEKETLMTEKKPPGRRLNKEAVRWFLTNWLIGTLVSISVFYSSLETELLERAGIALVVLIIFNLVMSLLKSDTCTCDKTKNV